MKKRVFSAVIGIPLLLGLTWIGGWYLAALVVLLSLLALREFLGIGLKAGILSHYKVVVVFCLLALGTFLTGYKDWLLPVCVLWFLIVFGRYALYYPEISYAEASYSFLALIYPVVLFTYLYSLRQLPGGIEWSFFVFLSVWVTDTGAFFIGNAFGKRKLAPRVSPNKSVEGALGGLAASLLLGFIFWKFTGAESLLSLLFLSLLVSMASQVGDLFESALKRTAGVKDSGGLIPGHGGILDRFDSFLFALPVVYYAVVLGFVR